MRGQLGGDARWFQSRLLGVLATAAVLLVAVGVAVRLRTTPAPLAPVPPTIAAPPTDRPSPAAASEPSRPRPANTAAGQAGNAADLQTLRGNERKVGAKTFRLVAGEWMDAAYDSLAGLDVVEVKTADDRVQLLRRMPALAPYSALGNRVTVVFDGVVYRFDTPAP